MHYTSLQQYYALQLNVLYPVSELAFMPPSEINIY